MRRLEQEEDLKRRIKQARASALGMMEVGAALTGAGVYSSGG